MRSHEEIKPIAIQQPEDLPAVQDERAAALDAMAAIQRELQEMESRRDELLNEERAQTRRSAVAEKLLAKLKNIERQFTAFVSDASPECAEIGVAFSEIAHLTLRPELVTDVKESAHLREVEIKTLLNPVAEGGLISEMTSRRLQLSVLQGQLDEPMKKYQGYLSDLVAWESKRSEVVGTINVVGSLAYLRSAAASLDEVPAALNQALDQRNLKTSEIYEKLSELTSTYRWLYAPVQEFIEKSPLASEGPGRLNFEASLTDSGFASGFFEFINQHKRGSFCGTEEGREALSSLLQQVDWATIQSVTDLLSQVHARLHQDYRQSTPPRVAISDQLRKEASVEGLYDFLYGLSYLRPRYGLQWGERDLDQLSPGERGTVLLLFYLLLDSRRTPLVIDQPEENLDNQTVYQILVPAIKEARRFRQIIMVTHNPNLAVVCDADQIICARFEKRGEYMIEYQSGSIENPSVNQNLIDILEGTRPAFDNRDRKYQEKVSAPV